MRTGEVRYVKMRGPGGQGIAEGGRGGSRKGPTGRIDRTDTLPAGA